MAPREAWTDERLDDLNRKVDDGFSEMRQEFRAQQRMIILLFGGMFSTTLVGFLGVIATILTQS